MCWQRRNSWVDSVVSTIQKVAVMAKPTLHLFTTSTLTRAPYSAATVVLPEPGLLSRNDQGMTPKVIA